MAVKKPITSLQRDALAALAYSLLPGSPCIIAGGFAADHRQARDLDLWVLSDPRLDRATDVLKDYGTKFHAHSDDLDSVPADERERSVVVVDTPLLPIHIIGCRESNVEDLLATFDISTHRWAWGRNGVLVAGPDATGVWEDGRVLTYRFPHSTDARVKKLEERYSITIAPFEAPTTGRKGKAA